jgi:hypothetical protein
MWIARNDDAINDRPERAPHPIRKIDRLCGGEYVCRWQITKTLQRICGHIASSDREYRPMEV